MLLFAQGAARSGRAEQPGPDRPVGHRAPPGSLINAKFPGAGRGARQYLPAHRRRRDRGAAPRHARGRASAPPTARTPRRCSSATIRATTATTSISRRSAAASAGAPPRTARTACRCTSPTRRTCRSSRSRWNIRCWSRAMASSRTPAAPGKYRGGLGLRRAVRPVGHTMTFSGQGERFINRPVGHLRRRKRRHRQIREALRRRRSAACRPSRRICEVKEDEAIVVETPGSGGYGKPCRARSGGDRERFRIGQILARLRQTELRLRAEGQTMSLRRDRHRRGHQWRRDRLSSAQGGAKTLLFGARRTGERRHRQERRDHPTELFDAAAGAARAC